MTVAPSAQEFKVPAGLRLFGAVLARWPGFFRALGNLETRLLSDELSSVIIDRPIYVTGLARSGSTVLLELLASHQPVVSHRYSDYPPIHTIYAWNRLLEKMPRRPVAPTERTHLDGIMVTPDSPEAFEEVLWMSFFDHLHDPARNNVLGSDTRQADFARYYREHIRKLLLLRGGGRYLAKGNYDLSRMGYIQSLFPDARFVWPVRDPVWHIASLMKQHRLFAAGERVSPAMLAHLRRVGHFEFGLDRRPINTGDDEALQAVRDCWSAGREVEGWARYWAMIHDFAADQLAGDKELAAATLVVRHEDLCSAPEATITTLQRHCGLDKNEPLLEDWARRLHRPNYYTPDFDDQERALIRDLAGASAARLGYDY